MSLWSGVIGIVIAGVGLLLWFREIEQWKWFVLAGAVSLMIAPYAALIEEHKIRKELEAIRPYLLIEEVPAEVIRGYSSQVPGNLVVPEAAYLPSYTMGQTPDAEILLYQVANVGEITARGLKPFCRVDKIDALGIETNVGLPKPDPQDKGMVLLRGRSILWYFLVPHGTFFSKGEGQLSVRVKLVVTYLGQPSDKNLYFYRVVFRTKQFAGPSERVRIMPGSIQVESSDEGIVTNFDDLLR